MEPFLMAAADENVLRDVSRTPSLIVANIRLVRQLENKKTELRRLKRSLKHKDQQILALRNHILEMKKKNTTPNDGTNNILVDFENMKVDEEDIDPDFRQLEVLEEEVIY
uniref:Uncharacterized protein n=1 Tax=Schizaphis graminum TaxID=13262 RepID=A0A2S2P5N8_SCHGA